ncbi:MAG: threonine synthase [Alphaproteobacteria bacterium]|nr:threonine synthase [Alphaproteobacteria bacterium]
MKYISTRHSSQGAGETLTFEEVMLAGLARDGGLYLPLEWPRLSTAEWSAMRGLPYNEVALRVMRPFVAGTFDEDEFARLVADSYRTFESPEVAPLKPLGDSGLHLLELFHGPTLAFKDVALQLLGRMLEVRLAARNRRAVIVGATSGDTGSAAIEAVRGKRAIDIFMMHPFGRVSEVQRRQMTTVMAPNVHNIAVRSTFDDCQDLAKACFADLAFRDRHSLTAVNSINFARVMAQIVYYAWAALRLGAPDRPVAFSVPTGNFGNVYAGYAAACMGLPISHFVVATNRNDILARVLADGTMATAVVEPSLSPSMDIQISSNFERLLFDLYGRDGKALAAAMQSFRATGKLALGEAGFSSLRRLFDGDRCDDEETVSAIADCHKRYGEVLDPHTAIGYAAAKRNRRDPAIPMVVLATAHPAKFPDAVERAIGRRPELPGRLADLMDRAERVDGLTNDVAALKRMIDERMSAVQPARAPRR